MGFGCFMFGNTWLPREREGLEIVGVVDWCFFLWWQVAAEGERGGQVRE